MKLEAEAKRIFSIENLVALTQVFGEANNLRRWTDFASDSRYDELAKQALNCATAFIIAKYCEHDGMQIDYTKFPKIALGRICAKVKVYYDTPEHKIMEICKIGGLSKETLDKAVKEQIEKFTSTEFADFVSEDPNSVEVKIYRAATKVATYLELTDFIDNYGCLNHKENEIRIELYEFMDFPGVKSLSNRDSAEFQLLKKISALRNSNRWAERYYLVACSVLGHLFDTACFGYILSLLRGESEEEATKFFWLGIFHDVAETWTKDIPSPVKAIIKGFREATEEYERQQLEANMYTQVHYWLSDAIRDVSMEESSNEHLKAKAKEADYLSADAECIRNLMAGSRDPYFVKVITENRRFETKEAEELHERYKRYALECSKVIPIL